MMRSWNRRYRDLRLGPVCTQTSFLFFASLLLAACSDSKQPVAEATPSPTPVAQTEQSQAASKNPPARANEVEAAVNRLFKGSALVDTRPQPSFAVGDFNGDLAQDLAVVLKPVPEKISELNREFPSWILRDLSRDTESNGPRLRIAANDVLLAIVHGYGNGGWREQEATQTYLLKHAVGSGLETRSEKELLAVNKGRKLPRLRGDVISQEVAGQPGFLYYAGATYAWYDPKTYTGDERERAMIHTAHNQGNKK